MSDFNQQHNRIVWFDLPVIELDRAIEFYHKVLAIDVFKEAFNDIEFAVIAHDNGNGGCLVVQPDNVGQLGPLIYLNTEGRIKDAVEQVVNCGGEVIQPIHSIGPHGCRALILDSEGNRVALHSSVDA